MTQSESEARGDSIVWKRMLSKNGNEYYVGRDVSSEGDDSEKARDAPEGEGSDVGSFAIVVNWVPQNNDNWIVLDAATKEETGITRYSLEHRDHWYKVYKYRLDFTCVKHNDYYFSDETGDIYNVNVFANGNHYVCYNSDKPTIVYITG